MQVLRQILGDQTTAVELWGFIVNLVLATGTALALSLAYTYWGASLSNRRKAAGNFVLLTITTAFIIAVIKSSLALSLGLVGALSIVRFRAAIKEPEELTFLFLAVAAGLGFGANQRLITLVAVGIAILVIGVRRLFTRRGKTVNLHLTLSTSKPGDKSLENVVDVLRPFTRQLDLVRFDDTSDRLEVCLLVEFSSFSKLTEAQAALKAWSGELTLRFVDNQGLV